MHLRRRFTVALMCTFLGGANLSVAMGPEQKLDSYGDPLPRGAVARLGTTRLRQGHSVSALAFSPDGKMLAAISPYGPARLWDTSTGRELRSLPESAGEDTVVAFSRDGLLLATGSTGNATAAVRVWEIASGQKLRTIEFANPGSLAFLPDGRTLAAAGTKSGDLRSWDATSGAEVPRLNPLVEFKKKSYDSVAFSADAELLASGASRGEGIRVWDLASGKDVAHLPDERSELVALSGDGRVVAFVKDYGRAIACWDWSSAKPPRVFREAHFGAILCLSFSTDGTTLASGGRDDIVRLWDVSAGKERFALRGHAARVQALAFSTDGKTLASGDMSGVIRLWDARTGKPKLADDGHNAGVTSVAVSPDGRRVFSGSRHSPPGIWQAATGRRTATLNTGAFFAPHIAVSPDGELLAAACHRYIQLWNVSTGERVWKSDEGESIESVAYASDGHAIAAGLSRSSIVLREPAKGKDLFRLPLGDVRSLAFSPSGKRLAALPAKGDAVHTWDLSLANQYHLLSRNDDGRKVFRVCFSATGAFLAGAGGPQSTVFLWELATGQEILEVPGRNAADIASLAISSHGGLLALGGKDGVIHLCALPSGKCLARLEGHRSDVEALAFFPDGRRLVSGSADTTLLVWDVTSFLPPKPKGPELSSERLESLWKDLGSRSVSQAYSAYWILVHDPEASIGFLKESLRRAPQPPDAAMIERWIADLDSSKYVVRDKAYNALAELGGLAVPALRDALAGKPSLEMRLRIERLLARDRGALPTYMLRPLRALGVLESIGTPDARQVLATVAREAPAGRLKDEAEAALKRVTARLAVAR